MNKKGFAFVETIVTLTVLMALLITLYTVFINLLQKEKTNTEYDNYGDQLSLFYYKEYLGDSKIRRLGKTPNTGEGNCKGMRFYAKEFGLDLTSNEGKNSGYPCNVVVMPCSEIESNKSIRKIKYWVEAYTDSYGFSLTQCSTVSKDFEEYRRQIDSCPKLAEYVILGEFKHKENDQYYYTYAHIYYPNY